ncbi:hypothetical protein HELRODRAFT_143589, partial [Helobdella robusta]|uniref:SOCS box domain-containing protein n=1 Tax=Helobdella robusta TaxID=6412 RepID=T1EJA8_HELRO
EIENSLPSESLVTSLEQSLCKTRTFKIIILGDSGVGKTCLATRLCQGQFPERTDATIGVDFRYKNLLIKDELVKLQIWDTAGQERYRKSMVHHFYRNVNAVVFVYDVTDLSSFENLPVWIHECESYHLKEDVLRIIIGNKCDIEPHKVLTSIAQRFADRYYMPLFETSAKDKSQSNYVDSIFITLAHKLMNSKRWLPSQ